MFLGRLAERSARAILPDCESSFGTICRLRIRYELFVLLALLLKLLVVLAADLEKSVNLSRASVLIGLNHSRCGTGFRERERDVTYDSGDTVASISGT